MNTTTGTITNLISKEGLTLTLERVSNNPGMDDFKGFHYVVTIHKGERTFTTFYSTGYGWIETKAGKPVPSNIFYHPTSKEIMEKKGNSYCGVSQFLYRIKKPTLADILDCLASDASCMEMSFEDFCREFGYSNDSIKAEETYRACKKNAKGLLNLLGKEAFETLVYHTERL